MSNYIYCSATLQWKACLMSISGQFLEHSQTFIVGLFGKKS